MDLELYFHIPFCVRKCLYCDFLSAPADKAVQDAYMKALLAEVEGRAGGYRDCRVSSAFIGGGTPSVVSEGWIARLLETVRGHFQVMPDAEITMELNPGTVDAEKLEKYFQAGVNRLSIGLQSTENKELAGLGRIHTYGQFLETYRDARRAGFANINVDVMSALPGQSLESYLGTLRRILELEPAPEHISAYSLMLEEGTPFYDSWKKGELELPDEDCEREMYGKTAEILGQAGFERYEISNYARDGYKCRHNIGYWQRADYIGFGIGAASLFRNRRFHNGSRLQDYLDEPLGCREDIQDLSTEEQMEEFMFLGLRMTAGIGYRAFRQAFGRTLEEVYGPVIAQNKENGLLHDYVDLAGERFLALTRRGLDLGSYVSAQFLFDS